MTCKDCIHCEACERMISDTSKMFKVLLSEILKMNCDIKYDSTNILSGAEICQCFQDRSRFVELPCKVGDTAWIIVRCKNGKDYFYTGIVTGVHVTDRKTIYKLPCKRFNYIVIRFLQTDSLKRINFNEIGKTVFFTKEAAEQALKEREKNEK